MTAPALAPDAAPEVVKYTPVDALTLKLLSQALQASRPEIEKRYDYAHQNQFGRLGKYWKGRRPESEAEMQKAVATLVMDDQILPAMEREVSALFGKDFEWTAVDGGNELDLNSDVVLALTDWHQEAQFADVVRDASRQRFWAGIMVGRVYIPDEYAEQLQANPPKDLLDALEYIHIESVDPRSGGPIIDAHGRVLGYWYRYTSQDGAPGEGGQQLIELHTRDLVRTFSYQGDQLTPVNEADNPFYDPANPGRLRRAEFLMFHVERDGGSALTQSLMDAQDRLNAETTYMGFNDDQSGYRQFITSNTERPVDELGNPSEFVLGPGVVLRLVGTPYDDVVDANEGLTIPRRHDPKWEVIEPLNPMLHHIPSRAEWKRMALEKVDQLWTLTPETQVSGVSKRESRKPFDSRVAFAGNDAGMFIAWGLKSALMLAGQVIEQSDQYRQVTFKPRMFLDIDRVNLEEVQVKLSMWQAGALTLTSLLEATPGVADPAAEEKKLEEEKAKAEAARPKDPRQARLEALLGTEGEAEPTAATGTPPLTQQ